MSIGPTQQIPPPGGDRFDRMAGYVPPRLQNIMSQFAGTGIALPQGMTPLTQDKPNAVDRFTGLPVTDLALEFGQYGLPVYGGAGVLLGLPVSFLVADKEARKQLTQLTEDYRADISQQLNVPEEAVNEQMMLMAARRNPGLQQAIQTIYEKKEKHPYVNGVGIGGAGIGAALAAFAAGPIGWTGYGLWAAILTASGAGAFAGEYAGRKIFDSDDIYNPMTHIDAIQEKRANGEPIKGADIFALRVAQNPGLNNAIKERYGANFFKLDDAQKLQVMQQCEGLMQCSHHDAKIAARPETNVKALMFGMLPDTPFTAMQQQGVYQPLQPASPAPAAPAPQYSPQPYWQSRVGTPPAARQGSFVERLQAQQAQMDERISR